MEKNELTHAVPKTKVSKYYKFVNCARSWNTHGLLDTDEFKKNQQACVPAVAHLPE